MGVDIQRYICSDLLALDQRDIALPPIARLAESLEILHEGFTTRFPRFQVIDNQNGARFPRPR
jgi:hypothetical protein